MTIRVMVLLAVVSFEPSPIYTTYVSYPNFNVTQYTYRFILSMSERWLDLIFSWSVYDWIVSDKLNLKIANIRKSRSTLSRVITELLMN